MNKADRDLIKKNLRMAKWNKGKSLTKEEGNNILKAHLNTTLKKQKPQNFKITSNEPTSISNLLDKFKEAK